MSERATEISAERFNSLKLSDAQLIAIRWVQGGRDLTLELEDAKGHPVILTFTWVDSLHAAFTSRKQEGGYLLSWSAEAVATDDGRISVSFDFAHRGALRFNCNELIP